MYARPVAVISGENIRCVPLSTDVIVHWECSSWRKNTFCRCSDKGGFTLPHVTPCNTCTLNIRGMES